MYKFASFLSDSDLHLSIMFDKSSSAFVIKLKKPQILITTCFPIECSEKFNVLQCTVTKG